MKHLTFAIVVFVLTGCGPNSSEKVLNELQAQRIKQEAAKAEAVKKRNENIKNMTRPFDPAHPLGGNKQ